MKFTPFGHERIERRTAAQQAGRRAKAAATAKGEDYITGNPQVFAESPEAFGGAAERYEASDFGLHGDRPPNLAIAHEKIEHRAIMFMKAQGLSNVEIAKATGYSQSWISQLCRQPWFKLGVLERMEEAGVDAVQTTLQGVTLDCVHNLIAIANGDTPGAKVSDIRAANDSLLDRVLGKARQTVEVNENRRTNEEVAALDVEIKEREARLAQIRSMAK